MTNQTPLPANSTTAAGPGPQILQEIEEARKKNDLDGLKKALLKAKSTPGANQTFINEAIKEVEQAETQTQATMTPEQEAQMLEEQRENIAKLY